MALFFNKIQRGNPGNPAAPKLWYPILKSIGKMSEKQVAKEVADETTLNPKEAEMALYQFQKVLTKALLDGKIVQLGELGSFQLTISSKGVENEKDVSARQIEKVNLRFTPSADLKEQLGKAHFKAAEKI